MNFTVLALTQAISRSSELPCVSTPFGTSLQSASLVPSVPSINAFYPSTNIHLSECSDSLAWGDSILEDPSTLHRIYFQNIDGVRNESDDIDLYVSSMAQFNIGTFCWADPGLDFSQFHIKQKLKHPLRSYFSAAKSAFSFSVLPKASSVQSGYQPGGTFMATTNHWAKVLFAALRLRARA